MSTTNIKNLAIILAELDCNPMEIAAFTANIETGPAVASEIAKHAFQNRVAIYEALKRLSEKGLVRITAKRNSKVRHFTPADIQTLTRKLEAKRTANEQALSLLEKIGPEIAQLYTNQSDKPTVLFFEGLSGIREALYDIIEQKPKELLAFSNSENFNDVYGLDWLQKYWNKRKAAGIITKGIIPRTPKAVHFYNSERNQKDMRTVRYIPLEWYKFNDNINIYGSNVQITSLQPGNEHTIIIRSKNIAKALQFLFELVWNTIAQTH